MQSTITTHTGAVIVNPKRLSYLQAGYKQRIDERPEAPRGKAAALTRYDETAGRFFFVMLRFCRVIRSKYSRHG